MAGSERSRGELTVWAGSSELDPGSLRPGADLVLDLAYGHADNAPSGVYAFDHLDLEQRAEIDRTAVRVLRAWRTRAGERLTRDGIRWSWVWEFEMHTLVVQLLAHAIGLRAALEATPVGSLELPDGDARTRRIAEAVAAAKGLSVKITGRPGLPGGPAAGPVPAPNGGRLADRAFRAVSRLGFPSALRRGSILVYPYWPLLPTLDRMLAEPGWRPAVWLENRPTSPVRTLRAAARGGWVGVPGWRDRRHASREARELAAAIEPDPAFVIDGLDLRRPAAIELGELVLRRAEGDVAAARLWRRALGGGRIARVLLASDLEPRSRIPIEVARGYGLPTTAIAHGAFLIPQPVVDLDSADEVILWSRAIAPPLQNLDRPIHEVGYPLPHEPGPYRRFEGGPAPRALVFGQLGHESTAAIDRRLTVASYQAAASAFFASFPGGELVIRPHPAEDGAAASVVAERFSGSRLRVDRATRIEELMEQADVCVGGTSAATLQAALARVPTAVLNLSGFDWPWPLGGETAVPVACSEGDLSSILELFREHGTLPGQGDLLRGLGATGEDSVAKILALLRVSPAAEPAPAAPSPA